MQNDIFFVDAHCILKHETYDDTRRNIFASDYDFFWNYRIYKKVYK